MASRYRRRARHTAASVENSTLSEIRENRADSTIQHNGISQNGNRTCKEVGDDSITESAENANGKRNNYKRLSPTRISVHKVAEITQRLGKRLITTVTDSEPNSHGNAIDQRPAPPQYTKGWQSRFWWLVSEAWWMIKMTMTTIFYLGFSPKWIVMTMRLFLFAICLTPAWVRLGKLYLFSEHIKRNLRYGPYNRNFLDAYLPINSDPSGAKRSFDIKGKGNTHLAPVVVFITGGAWIIGYKAWGALLAITLQRCGILVIAPDYRNFPQGRIGDMVDDITNTLSWVNDHAEAFGGNKNCIFLSGQSAGAHIAMLALILKAKLEIEKLTGEVGSSESDMSDPESMVSDQDEILIDQETHLPTCPSFAHGFCNCQSLSFSNDKAADILLHADRSCLSTSSSSAPHFVCHDKALHPTWHTSQILGMVCVSGVYNMIESITHFEDRGLPASIMFSIMSGRRFASISPNKQHMMSADENSVFSLESQPLIAWSPTLMAHLPWFKRVRHLIPPILLLHGKCDQTAYWHMTEQFGRSLSAANVRCAVKYYDGFTHTDPILEGPMSGHNHLANDFLALIYRLTKLKDKTADEFKCIQDIHDDSLPIYLQHSDGTLGNSDTCNQSGSPDIIISKPICSLFLIRAARFFNPF